MEWQRHQKAPECYRVERNNYHTERKRARAEENLQRAEFRKEWLEDQSRRAQREGVSVGESGGAEMDVEMGEAEGGNEEHGYDGDSEKLPQKVGEMELD